MALVHSPKIVTDNLVLCLDAGNTKSYPGSGTTWNDISGNGHTAIINGATFNTDVFDFDGTNDYINANTALPNSFWQGNYTTSVWIYFNSIDSDSQGQVIFHHGSGSNYNGLHIIQRSSKVALALWGTYLTSTSTVSASTWYNLAFTLNNTTNACVIYINGSLDASSTLTASYTGSGNNCRIAGPAYNFIIDYLDGKIEQVLCYDRVITAAEVAQNYNALKGRYGL